MVTFNLILLILALMCFVASAAGVPSRINLPSLGWAFVTLAMILVRVP